MKDSPADRLHLTSGSAGILGFSRFQECRLMLMLSPWHTLGSVKGWLSPAQLADAHVEGVTPHTCPLSQQGYRGRLALHLTQQALYSRKRT